MEEIGRSIIRLESVDSTNNYTANRVRANELRHGAVILAVEQTSGRGQMGASWETQAGMNLTFSVFLDRVNLSVERQFILTKIVSLSLVDLLAVYGVQAKIKWPNDIYVGETKIAGVLIENSLRGGQVNRSIVGIGLNVNQTAFSVPNATSLRNELGSALSTDEVLFSFIARFNGRRTLVNSDKLHDEYLENLLGYQQERTFEDDRGVFNGTIQNVRDTGQLMVDREGELCEYNLKEIQFMR